MNSDTASVIHSGRESPVRTMKRDVINDVLSDPDLLLQTVQNA